MGISATDAVKTIGEYDNRITNRYTSSKLQQERINHIAKSISYRYPSRVNDISSALCFWLFIHNISEVNFSSNNLNRPKGNHTKQHECDEVSTLSNNLTLTCIKVSNSQTNVSDIPVKGITTLNDPHLNNVIKSHLPREVQPEKTMLWSGFASFPMAAATPTANNPIMMHFNAEHGFVSTEDEGVKNTVIDLLIQHLENSGELSPYQLENLKLSWRVAVAEGSITAKRYYDESSTMLSSLDNSVLLRTKRIALSQKKQYIAEHIEKNCAFETDIYSHSEHAEGKILIIKAQRAENPLRLLYESIPGYTPSNIVVKTAKAANFILDIITLGFKPVIGNLFADYYRYKYFQAHSDTICADRQLHLAFAQVATMLEVDGLKNYPFLKKNRVKPIELPNVQPPNTQATYLSRNKNNGVQHEIFLTTKCRRSDNTENTYYLKTIGEYEFEMLVPNLTNTGQKKITLTYDKQNKKWRSSVEPDSFQPTLDISEGESYITLYDTKYPIVVNSDNNYAIKVTDNDNTIRYLPVYQNPLSKTWQLRTTNHEPAYTETQIKLIEALRIEPEPLFQYYAKEYSIGEGLLYEARPLNDDIFTTQPLYTVVEMNARLIPIRMTISNHGTMVYQAYDIKNSIKPGIGVEWIREQWHFKTWSSPHISSSLNKLITNQYLSNSIDESKLSAPDIQGIKYYNGRGYIKFELGYVEVVKGDISIIGNFDDASLGKRMRVHYANGQFHPLTKELKTQHDSIRAIDLIKTLKDQSKQRIIENTHYIDISNNAKETYGDNNVNVIPTSSIDLDKKRFIVDTNDDKLVIETDVDGKNVRLLVGTEKNDALVKYDKVTSDITIKHIMTIKREDQGKTIQFESIEKSHEIAHQQIQECGELIREAINKLDQEEKKEKSIILGHSDFSRTSNFENNIFPSINSTYQALIDVFIPLSKENPNTIIVPGTFYMSHPIPKKLNDDEIKFKQNSHFIPINHAITVYTTIAPVFYNGKIISIGRKGEYLSYIKVQSPQNKIRINIPTLDDNIPNASVIEINNVKPNVYLDSSEIKETQSSSIFAGKTLLPSEHASAEIFFGPLYDKNGEKISIDNLFSSSFMIDGEKFLLIIEDEFIRYGDIQPTIINMALNDEKNINDSNYYDWFLHPSAGEKIDTNLQSTTYNYLNADFFSAGELVSKHGSRLRRRGMHIEKSISLDEFLEN